MSTKKDAEDPRVNKAVAFIKTHPTITVPMAAPEQWLGKFMRLCVIIIKQLSRRTAGEENGVRRARGEEPGRRAESDECRGRAAAAAAMVALCSARVGKLT